MSGIIGVLSRRVDASAKQCLLVVDGRPCDARAPSRGICLGHSALLRQHGRYEEFALPFRGREPDRIELKPPEQRDTAICRVIVNGNGCARPIGRRGLCNRHYHSIWQREDLALEDFCLPVSTVRTKSEPVSANAAPEPLRFQRRRNIPAGSCVVATNGVGCSEKAEVRGLCREHYNRLRPRPETFAAIADPKAPKTAASYAKKENPSRMECGVIVNGTPCTSSPRSNGLCARHYKALHASKIYQVADFVRLPPPPTLRVKSAIEQLDSLCVAVMDGVGCTQHAYSRGLCRHHVRMAGRLGKLDELAQPVKPAVDPRPSVYLDKNVLMDYLDYLVVGRGFQPSVRLVDEVRAGRVVGTVSVDAVKSAYNRLRYRLGRATDDGGEGRTEGDAETIARTAVQRLFDGRGAWRLVSLDVRTFVETVVKPMAQLSLEDSLEWQSYQIARAKPGGPSAFVTRDRDPFPESVHPQAMLEALGLRAAMQ